MLDLVIRDGLVVDGSGAPAQVMDVGVRDGTIVAVGHLDDAARRVVDAAGLAVMPGVIDVHTHYDAQVGWDPLLTPSSLHGVTTVLGGNCGFTVAPAGADDHDYLMRMLSRVEGIPLASLDAGVAWSWESFGDYLDGLEGKLAVNAGFLVGHSTLRRVAMGESSVAEPATEAHLETMARLLRESLAAGALGFSSSLGISHFDGNGDPVPSRAADDAELAALAAVVGEFPGSSLELMPGVPPFTDAEIERMADLSRRADRPLNWNLFVITAERAAATERQLSVAARAAALGGRVVALTLPATVLVYLNFVSGFSIDALPGWAPLFKLSLDERKAVLADPQQRERLRRQASTAPEGQNHVVAWPHYRIVQTFTDRNRELVGRSIGEIATAQGKDPFTALLDVVLADDLRTILQRPAVDESPETWDLRARTWRDPGVVLGGSDAGAHVDSVATFGYPVTVLGEMVRERGLLTLEEAAMLLSDVPARLYGLHDRGRVAEGFTADLVVFDPERIRTGPIEMRHDLPGGAGRLYSEPEGIEHVFVRGVEIVAGGRGTGALPGTVLRSGRDTVTVPASSR